MSEVSVTRLVGAPVEAVWETVTDVGRYPERVGSYVRVEFLSSQRTGVGARWRQWRTVFGRQHDQTLEIVAWDPPHRLVTQARESGAAYETTYRLESEPDGTVVSVTFEARPTNPLAGLFQRLLGSRFMESTRQAMDDDLSEIAAVLEEAV